MIRKNLAFTLAEVLIVIGIIGVVAALTLPNLNHATGDKERVTKVKKIYSALTEAFDRAQVIYGDYDTWFKDDDTAAQQSEKMGKRITEFMKISKDCEHEWSSCFNSANIKYANGNSAPYNIGGNTTYSVITSDNVALMFSNGGQSIYADIDGPKKGENGYGHDIFWFIADRDKNLIRPNGYDVDLTDSGNKYNLFSVGGLAAGWIIENDNADYLKANENGKCNDSDIILDGTTNTSCH